MRREESPSSPASPVRSSKSATASGIRSGAGRNQSHQAPPESAAVTRSATPRRTHLAPRRVERFSTSRSTARSSSCTARALGGRFDRILGDAALDELPQAPGDLRHGQLRRRPRSSTVLRSARTSYGRLPASISKSVTPRAKTSVFPSWASPRHCSGAMYAGRPGEAGRLAEEVGEAEVHHLHAARRGEEDVGRLEVAVQEPRRVRVGERPRHLGPDVHRLGHGHRPARQAGRQRLAPQELEDEVRPNSPCP